jgi:hypothetical protein
MSKYRIIWVWNKVFGINMQLFLQKPPELVFFHGYLRFFYVKVAKLIVN